MKEWVLDLSNKVSRPLFALCKAISVNEIYAQATKVIKPSSSAERERAFVF